MEFVRNFAKTVTVLHLGQMLCEGAVEDIQRDERVVVISTAHGLTFTPFKVGYHEGTLEEVEGRFANPPVYLPADAGVVKETIKRKLGG